jgi:hypothetical protein
LPAHVAIGGELEASFQPYSMFVFIYIYIM